MSIMTIDIDLRFFNLTRFCIYLFIMREQRFIYNKHKQEEELASLSRKYCEFEIMLSYYI